MRKKLSDSAMFWLAMGVGVITLGGVLIALSATGVVPPAKPAEPWFAAGIGLAALGAMMLVWAAGLFVWQRHAERRLRAELTVVFDPNDPGCVQNRATHPQRDLQLRLRATNTGTVVLTGVRDRLRSRHDHIGRIRHDNDPPFERSHGGVTLQVGASEYFDIAFCQLDLPHMVVQYADGYLLLQEQLINRIQKADRTPVEVVFEGRREDTRDWISPVTKRYVVAPARDGITLLEGGGSRSGEGGTAPSREATSVPTWQYVSTFSAAASGTAPIA